jgi:hypothetical protein
MISGSTREFMALCAIAQHFGRPGSPTDQAVLVGDRIMHEISDIATDPAVGAIPSRRAAAPS